MHGCFITCPCCWVLAQEYMSERLRFCLRSRVVYAQNIDEAAQKAEDERVNGAKTLAEIMVCTLSRW